MKYIDPTYDVILTYSPIIEITGHLFECFDYYLFLRNYYKVGILLFNSLPIEQLKIAWNSKYTVDFNDVVNDFIFINIKSNNSTEIIKFGKNTVVIITDGNIRSLQYHQIILSTQHLYGFLCRYDNFHLATYNKHIIYLMDQRVYGGATLQFFNTINYVKKLPFKYYKKYDAPNKNIGMMYTTYVCRYINPNTILEFHQMSKCSKTLLIVPYKKPEFDNLPNIEQVEAPINNLFEKFDTYIYTPVAKHFDCSPRLVTECFLHKRKIISNNGYTDPGFDTRYNDCITNLNSLNLNENDDIIKIIESAKQKYDR